MKTLSPRFRPLLEKFKTVSPGETLSVGGTPGALFPAAIWALAMTYGPVLAVSEQKGKLTEALAALCPSGQQPAASWPDPPWAAAALIRRLAAGGVAILVLSPEDFEAPIPHPEAEFPIMTLSPGQTIAPDKVASFCDRHGFLRVATVEEGGEYAKRGGILDFFPPGEPLPIRLDFVGDQLELIKRFDPQTQRSVVSLSGTFIFPAGGAVTKETTLAEVAGAKWPVATDFLLPSPLSPEVRQVIFSAGEGDISLEGRSVTDWLPPSQSRSFKVEGQKESLLGPLVKSLKKNLSEGIVVVAPNQRQRQSLEALLSGAGLRSDPLPPEALAGLLIGGKHPGRGSVFTTVGTLTSGVVLKGGPAIVTEEDLFGIKKKRPHPSKPSLSYLDLEIGDFVVHDDHGIGRYRGLKTLVVEGESQDFVTVEYADRDRVYLPVTRLDGLARYIGPEEIPPSLDKLGGSRWRRARNQSRRAAEALAKELVELYARREVARRPPCSPDTPWQREFESGFEFIETEDQVRAIEDVKADLESEQPMDRLVCGDVGYGKTEVAMRASFKVVMDGRQVAFLVPTTILAMQHYQTFLARFSSFPIRVETLSRFTPRPQIPDLLRDLANGKIDILIGTHRILQKDVSFANLGLVILDEEHRFGVRQKERFKNLRSKVDILALSATPIPRTLFLSLAGIRTMSTIETPPEDRLPIMTKVLHFSPHHVREVIEKELARGGQIYFVHNRIQTLPQTEAFLRELIPGLRMETVHGQLPENRLEEIMWRFFRKEFDLLLSTAIVESGLDVSLTNTIIIDRADRFGLAQLYQLRGRVGRRGIQAYSYLLVRPEDRLSADGRRRLDLLEALSAEGGGYRLATWDLELRGAGNLLGAEQSGHLAAVGLEHYSRILRAAVAALQGEPVEIEPTIRLHGEAYLPESYIPDPYHRLALYRRLSGVSSSEQLGNLREELQDRFGPWPPAVETLLGVVEIKSLARAEGIALVEYHQGMVRFIWDPSRFPGKAVFQNFFDQYPRIVPCSPTGFALPSRRISELVNTILGFLRSLRT